MFTYLYLYCVLKKILMITYLSRKSTYHPIIVYSTLHVTCKTELSPESAVKFAFRTRRMYLNINLP